MLYFNNSMKKLWDSQITLIEVSPTEIVINFCSGRTPDFINLANSDRLPQEGRLVLLNSDFLPQQSAVPVSNYKRMFRLITWEFLKYIVVYSLIFLSILDDKEFI